MDQKYDGLTISNDGRYTTISYDISEALDQANIRNIFLNGQLFIEFQCDQLLSDYFCKGSTGLDNRRRALFSAFLRSRGINFFAKINLLSTLEIFVNSQREKLITAKIKSSLKAIGAVRNAFHHNLEYEDALKNLSPGDKFSFMNKKLSSYQDVEILKGDFKVEAANLYSELHELAFKIAKFG